MKQFISKIPNNVQDTNSKAWEILCQYIDDLADSGHDEFSPAQVLGLEHYSRIHTLPQSINKLKQVKKMSLYGSQLKRIPPEIGEMEALEYFDPYTSYNLHWFPFEITNCKNLKDSRVSTRALYGNFKLRNPFPSLHKNQVRYDSDEYRCGNCKKVLNHGTTEQYWITLPVATDYMPLLVNVCSNECRDQLPVPDEGYIQHAHKGGGNLQQPKLSEMEYLELRNKNRVQVSNESLEEPKKRKLFSVVKKIWE